jgi:short-subunit dehydrogenase
MKVKDKTIVVTGGGNGVGRRLALNLLAKGAEVIAVDISKAGLLETMQLAEGKAKNLSTHILDITDRVAVETFARQVMTQYCAVDGLINNAGILQPFSMVNNLDYATIEKVININYYGTLYLTKAFLPHFLKRPEAHVVNVSSMGGLIPVQGQSIYGAVKVGVALLTEGLRSELRNTNVKLTLVCPGAMATDIKFNSGTDNRQLTNEDVKNAFVKPVQASRAAQIIINAMEKNKLRVLIGKDIKVMNVLNKLCPKLTRYIINQQMKAHLPE